MGFFSKDNIPPGKSSIIAEISTRKGDGLHSITDALLMEKTISDLDRVGIINKRDIAATDVTNIEYGYVIYDLEYRKNIELIKKYFSSIGVELLGRFAEFEYLNMDEIIKRSMVLAERLNTTK